jgi:hypothetical protein
MGQANDNVMMRQNKGMVGGQVVYRVRGGKTIVSNAPKKRLPGSATTDQLGIQDLFRKAVRYAKKIKNNLFMKAQYQDKVTGGQTAYNLALSDAFKAPEVLSIDTSAYTGDAGQTITIEAADNFKVNTVKVVITGTPGTLIEQGEAVENEENANWTYITAQTNNNLAGTKITVTATDLPGNEGTLEVTL